MPLYTVAYVPDPNASSRITLFGFGKPSLPPFLDDSVFLVD